METHHRSEKGILHVYTPGLVAFEHTASESAPPATSHIIFICGLGDGLLSVPYASEIACKLPKGWSLVSVLLSSAYKGWGTTTLSADAAELNACVRYFRSLHQGGKIVLFGHSTGCQDSMEYLTGSGASDRAPVDGVVFQASVSDRQAILTQMPRPAYDRSVQVAKEWVDAGRGTEVLPADVISSIFGPTSICSANRWLSLSSPNHDGDDDFFSSDLTADQYKQTWGRIPATSPILILYSGSDQYVPPEVDKAALVERWAREFIEKGQGIIDNINSGIVEGASHNLVGDPDSVVADLVSRVVKYVGRLDQNEFTQA